MTIPEILTKPLDLKSVVLKKDFGTIGRDRWFARIWNRSSLNKHDICANIENVFSRCVIDSSKRSQIEQNLKTIAGKFFHISNPSLISADGLSRLAQSSSEKKQAASLNHLAQALRVISDVAESSLNTESNKKPSTTRPKAAIQPQPVIVPAKSPQTASKTTAPSQGLNFCTPQPSVPVPKPSTSTKGKDPQAGVVEAISRAIAGTEGTPGQTSTKIAAKDLKKAARLAGPLTDPMVKEDLLKKDQIGKAPEYVMHNGHLMVVVQRWVENPATGFGHEERVLIPAEKYTQTTSGTSGKSDQLDVGALLTPQRAKLKKVIRPLSNGELSTNLSHLFIVEKEAFKQEFEGLLTQNFPIQASQKISIRACYCKHTQEVFFGASISNQEKFKRSEKMTQFIQHYQEQLKSIGLRQLPLENFLHELCTGPNITFSLVKAEHRDYYNYITKNQL